MTIFTKIINKEIPSEIVFENEQVLAFKDIMPQAPVHLLFIHKISTTNINELVNKQPEQLLQLFQAITEYTESQGLEESGFRLVINTNKDAGQTVFHTHIHVLGGAGLGSFGSKMKHS
jgi:histidine triad (HIT) family protein